MYGGLVEFGGWVLGLWILLVVLVGGIYSGGVFWCGLGGLMFVFGLGEGGREGVGW
jgi:hypothetical protein